VKEIIIHIVSGCDRYVLFSLLVYAHKNLNPIVAIEVVVPFVVNSEKGTSLCDFMGTNEKMVLSMVKEQSNYYHRIKKVECKYLAWWKLHEGQFSYVVFVVQQILMVVGW